MEFVSKLYKTKEEIIKEYELTEGEQVYLLEELQEVEEAAFKYLMML